MTSTTCTTAPRCATPSAGWSLAGLALLMRSRRALAALDDAALRDIGLSRADAVTEARRPVWNLPKTWRM